MTLEVIFVYRLGRTSGGHLVQIQLGLGITWKLRTTLKLDHIDQPFV